MEPNICVFAEQPVVKNKAMFYKSAELHDRSRDSILSKKSQPVKRNPLLCKPLN